MYAQTSGNIYKGARKAERSQVISYKSLFHNSNMSILENEVDLFATHDDMGLDEGYLRRLSLYATIRPEDIKQLRPDFHLSRKRHHINRQSLQDLFNHSTPFIPSTENTPIEESNETSSSESLIEVEAEQLRQKVVDGKDIPVQYCLNGIRDHELPVIGFHIDDRICPGFAYRVRYIGGDDVMYDGQARILQSIGIGYGRRMTFRGETLNYNENYFWSDSHPEGFAFSIVAVEKGDRYMIYNSMTQVIGEVLVEEVDQSQTEISTTCEKGSVKKQVRVRITVSVTYFHRNHGALMEITCQPQQLEILDGIAEYVRQKGSREAATQRIVNVHLPRYGDCSLWKEV